MIMVVLENVNKIYNEGTPRAFEALKSIDLEVSEGECVVLSGVSGSGKSTLLSLIAALDKPSRGKIAVNGELISKLPDLHASAYRAKTIGVIFQHFNLLESLSVEENVIVPLINSGFDMRTIKALADKSMELAAISHKASQEVKALSGGEKQRCAIARALIHEPKLILCDEPTANLDRANSLKFIEILQSLHDMGKTIIVATHDPLFEGLPFVSKVVHMEDGRIVKNER
ncbi:ABC transporter ATP-binding protein [Sulfurovum lithotrophicum]|uniref:ABC transporter ATP-binding protein n=1 Tax=Sulfurovum lithotrophicum TaxID=206403 RepID=A0A7U4LZJ2_9BACT|nr:ABC transporter ATP-binding protein [Sulfurovum lithotrophicum]AKF24104.1 ABC transporter ATP-binding protein [Sulfurovum lithotrophicum]